jgi:hypothetical protein
MLHLSLFACDRLSFTYTDRAGQTSQREGSINCVALDRSWVRLETSAGFRTFRVANIRIN